MCGRTVVIAPINAITFEDTERRNNVRTMPGGETMAGMETDRS